MVRIAIRKLAQRPWSTIAADRVWISNELAQAAIDLETSRPSAALSKLIKLSNDSRVSPAGRLAIDGVLRSL